MPRISGRRAVVLAEILPVLLFAPLAGTGCGHHGARHAGRTGRLRPAAIGIQAVYYLGRALLITAAVIGLGRPSSLPTSSVYP